MSDTELKKLHRLAQDRDVSASVLLRHWVRDLYTQRFGNEPPTELVDARRAPKRARRRRSS